VSAGAALGGAGWAAGRVVVPGTEAQLGAFGLFAPALTEAPIAVPFEAPAGTDGAVGGTLLARAADSELLWLTFDEVARAGAAGIGWADLASRHALWVVDGVPVLHSAAPEAVAAFLGLVEVLHAADVPLIVVAPRDPGPMRRPLPIEAAHDGVLPRLEEGS
jgi:predicted ATPase